MADDRQSVKKRLQAYADDIQGLMDLVDPDKYKPQDAERAKERYSDLKSRMAADAKKWSTQRDRKTMTPLERSSFYPVVFEALTRLQAATNSNPIKSDWFSDLYSARVDVTHYLNQL